MVGPVSTAGGKANRTIHIGSKAVLIVGVVLALALVAVVAGVIPLSYGSGLGLIVICALMMLFMMRNMHGDPDGRS